MQVQVQVRDNPFRTAAPFQAPGEREPAESSQKRFLDLPDGNQQLLLAEWLFDHPADMDDVDEVTANFNRYELESAVLKLNNTQLGAWLRSKVHQHFASRIEAVMEQEEA